VPSKKDVVLSVLAETGDYIPAAVDVLAEHGSRLTGRTL
jgi:hypothetical protein